MGTKNSSANDIDFRYLTPSEDPINTFDVHHVSLAYGIGANFSNNIRVGIKSTFIYNQLYVDESVGYNFDLGISYDYNQLMSIGMILNQLGFEKNNTSSIQYPLLTGIGVTFNLKPLYSQIHSDILYNQSFSDEVTFKISSDTQFSYLNIITGYHYSNSKNEFSCGLSFKYRKIQFDYGISFHKALGTPIIFSLKYHI